MAKKAFCVGINDYPLKGSDLKGCVNDANAWADLLVDHYGFTRSDIKLLLNSEATKANIISGLKSLLGGARSGDTLVFTNSSHGTYVADKDGDEEMYDEAICPYDYADNLIVDDELRTLFGDLPKRVSLTVILDSCFSGSGTRLLSDSGYQKARFLDPALMGRGVLKERTKARRKGEIKYPESEMEDVLLSGSNDNEPSYDAQIDGAYHGVMTYYALKAIREANYRITFRQLHKKLLESLEKARYQQHPQLEGKKAKISKEVFK
jgi:hypothetical protein